MDYFSLSMLSKQTPSSSTEPLLAENETSSVDIPITDNNNRRRSSRPSLRNSDAWARKRALMQRGYEWTTTLDREMSVKTAAEYHVSNTMKSLPNSIIHQHIQINKKNLHLICQ
jgi:hypothetical protein